MELFRQRPRSLREVLHGAAQSWGSRPYVVFPQRQITYEEMPGIASTIASSLHDRYGIGRGDRVAIASANRIEYVLSFWATTLLGAVTVGLNGWWTGAELTYALELTEPSLLLGDERRLDRINSFRPPTTPSLCFDEEFDELETVPILESIGGIEIDESDPYLILFTSGTTGRAKGAVISHRSTVHFGLATQLRAAENVVRSAARGDSLPEPYVPCSIAAAPLFHVGGLNAGLALAPQTGMTQVYPPAGRWSEEVHLALTESHAATAWSLVPTQLWRLLDFPNLEQYDLTSLRTIGGGSAVWPPQLLKRLEQQIPWARPGLTLGYGMTETNGHGTFLTADSSHTHPDSVGRVAPTARVDVRNPLSRISLRDGEVGEIAIRTPSAFTHYWGNEAATTAAFDEDRWYHTGDFGRIEDGYLYLEGRRQDLIIRGGENISPIEIENRLFEHPDVLEATVLGVDHPQLGQEVKAVIVPRQWGLLSEDQVRMWCAAALAEFKVPTHVEFLHELPHNATGKVLKNALLDPGSADLIEE